MSESRRQALSFLQTPSGAPWRWEEGGRVLVWSDGTTIAFRQEVNAIVERLAARSLPPFDSIVLLLAACRGKFSETSTHPSGIPDQSSRSDFARVITARAHQQTTTELSKVKDLPDSLIKSASGKAFLAETVFEPYRSFSKNAGEILTGIREDFSDQELNTPATDAKPFNSAASSRLLITGLSQHTAQSLTQRLKTGLDSLPKAVEGLALPPDERARRLLADLTNAPEHAGLALAAREVMAAIRLPSLAEETEEFALGGASGLGNRGTLDRLLLSELAHDDMTLATRVALNEALYIHREPPVLKPERSLTLVMDSGLRMWGIPRVIAASAALALVAGHRGTGAVNAWRPEGNTLSPIDFLSKNGLEDHLTKLRTELDPRQALPALNQAVATDRESDVVLITHRDCLDDLTFQGRLASLESGRGFLLLIDNNGLVQLHPLPWGSPRPLSQVQVQIDKLFEARPAKARPSLIDPAKPSDLPAIFREPRFPLLFSANTKMQKIVPTSDGGLGVTTDRRLLKWARGPLGAEQLLTDLPDGMTCWLKQDEDGRCIIVKGRGGDGCVSVTILEPKGMKPRIIRFTGPQIVSAVHQEPGVLLVILNTRVAVVSLETFELLAETEYPPGLQWISGRYFSPGTGVKFICWNGSAVQWDSPISGQSLSKNEIVLAFERDGVGVWLLLRNGTILNPTGGKFMETGLQVLRAHLAQRGNVLVVTVKGSKALTSHAIYLSNKTTAHWPSYKTVDSLDWVPFPSRPMQNRFNAIHAEPGQPLRLRKSKSNTWLEISVTPKSLRLAESSGDKAHLDRTFRAFAASAAPVSLGCSLHEASWPDGSKAWLDSRGLLHLRSHDSSIPEVTLTLNQGDMVAWSSDGHQCGIPFFAGKDRPVTTARAAEVLKTFCERLC